MPTYRPVLAPWMATIRRPTGIKLNCAVEREWVDTGEPFSEMIYDSLLGLWIWFQLCLMSGLVSNTVTYVQCFSVQCAVCANKHLNQWEFSVRWFVFAHTFKTHTKKDRKGVKVSNSWQQSVQPCQLCVCQPGALKLIITEKEKKYRRTRREDTGGDWLANQILLSPHSNMSRVRLSGRPGGFPKATMFRGSRKTCKQLHKNTAKKLWNGISSGNRVTKGNR